ncbi:hypothetical protein [Streptomyces boncukensis]|uniref:Uncharacterized protein n=1 Tax=Streptomyces boncukensis TaxID=2711219 RepID=A0A6G4X5D3_9ACTN|nr:hypothetical protein [Streptomyces boncukensis]NGO72746.1 hypothetical protein [Streptomyces boncukensis]
MGTALETLWNVLLAAALLTLLLAPALLGERRERRIDRQLRDAERGRPAARKPLGERTAVHLTTVPPLPAPTGDDTCAAA